MNRATSEPRDLFAIADLAREFDISTRTIRFYESKGLLSPERAGQNRQAACGDGEPPVGPRPSLFGRLVRHHTAGLVTVTDLPQSDIVICTLLPGVGSSFAWTSS